MKDEDKTKEQLIAELSEIRKQIGDLKFADKKHRKVEDALLASRDQLERIVNGMHEGLLVISPGYHVLDANERLYEMTGKPMQQVIGKPCYQVNRNAYKPCSEDGLDCPFETVMKTGKPARLEVIYKGKQGKDIVVETNSYPLFGVSGSVESVVLISNDITERKRTEEELIRIKQAVDTSSDAVGMSTKEGHHFYQNEAFNRLFGYTVEEVSEIHPQALYGDNDIAEEVFKTIMAGDHWSGEIEMVANDGHRLPVSLRASAIKNKRGEILGLIGMHTDITERKNIQEQLEQYQQHLEELVEERTADLKSAQEKLLLQERLATLGELAGSISHEIRNPLGVIDSSVYFLTKTHLPEIDEKSKEHFNRIREAVRNSTEIIESLLNLTRMEPPHTERLDLIDVVCEAIASSDVPDTIHIEKAFPEAQLWAEIDPQQLRMVFKNLVKNAVDAMGGKGTIKIAMRLEDGGQIAIMVIDTGQGIPKENLDKVFQPLFSTKAKGIGFGLSISKMIVEKHGGTIEICTSEVGNGSEFLIRLPVAKTK